MSTSGATHQAWIDLPPHIRPPFDVYINGVPQQEGQDYDLVGRAIRFSRSIDQEGSLGPIRWLSILLGIAGTYRNHDTVDIIYEQDGRRLDQIGLTPRAR